MTLPDLESLTPALDRACADVLGDTIQYAADGEHYVPLKAEVDYRDAAKALDGATAIEQDIQVSVLKVDVPVKPDAAVRITLTRRPGVTFRPYSPRTDQSGTGWEFEVKAVAGG